MSFPPAVQMGPHRVTDASRFRFGKDRAKAPGRGTHSDGRQVNPGENGGPGGAAMTTVTCSCCGAVPEDSVAVTGPEDQDYGKREGSHLDPDGNKIRFGSLLRSGPS